MSCYVLLEQWTELWSFRSPQQWNWKFKSSGMWQCCYVSAAWHSEGLSGIRLQSQAVFPNVFKALLSFETSATTHPTTQHHISRLNCSVNGIISIWLNWLHCSDDPPTKKHIQAIHICYYDCIMTCPTRRKSDSFQMGNHKLLRVLVFTHSPWCEVPWLTLSAAES